MTVRGEDHAGDPAVTDEMTSPFIRHLGVELTEVSGDVVVARWKAGEHLHQPFGILHGGAHCSVVETLASVGAAVWLGDKGKVVGVNNNTDFFRGVPRATSPPRPPRCIAAGRSSCGSWRRATPRIG